VELNVPVVEVADLVKEYDGRRVLDGVSFVVEEGEIFGIVGPNGAGKTTLVESIEGLRQPDGGSIRVLSLDPIDDRYELAQRLGAQLQESRLQNRVRVGEILETFSSFYRNPADWRELASRFGLDDKINATYASLSGGMKQRLSAALALVGSPEIVVLDELTSGLDPRARRSMWDAVERIRGTGVTVILVTHFMDEAERLCDRVMVVNQGCIEAIDSPAGLIRLTGSEQTMTFQPSKPVSLDEIRALPGVVDVLSADDHITITGVGNVVLSVLTSLVERGVTADQLRVDRTSLEDAYLALTGETTSSSVEWDGDE
jgi:ABC-2 type transport system ATP-binding protein